MREDSLVRGNNSMTRRTIKKLLIAFVVSMSLLIIAFLGVAWWYLPIPPWLDDGPFKGVAVTAPDTQQADQIFPIFNGMTLEIYDPENEDASPIVQLRKQDGAVRWSIRADGWEAGDVESIRFEQAEKGFGRCGTVYGVVKWTYGTEATHWFITSNGDLRDYYYSW